MGSLILITEQLPIRKENHMILARHVACAILVVCSIANAQDTHPTEGVSERLKQKFEANHRLSYQEWRLFISQDARLETLIALVGKPDDKEERPELLGSVGYKWLIPGLVEDGTKLGATLLVYSLPHQGKPFIYAIKNPLEESLEVFPWSDRLFQSARSEFQK